MRRCYFIESRVPAKALNGDTSGVHFIRQTFSFIFLSTNKADLDLQNVCLSLKSIMIKMRRSSHREKHNHHRTRSWWRCGSYISEAHGYDKAIKESLICDSYLALHQQTAFGPPLHLQAAILFDLKPSTVPHWPTFGRSTVFNLECTSGFGIAVIYSYCLPRIQRTRAALFARARDSCVFFCFFFAWEKSQLVGRRLSWVSSLHVYASGCLRWFIPRAALPQSAVLLPSPSRLSARSPSVRQRNWTPGFAELVLLVEVKHTDARTRLPSIRAAAVHQGWYWPLLFLSWASLLSLEQISPLGKTGGGWRGRDLRDDCFNCHQG